MFAWLGMYRKREVVAKRWLLLMWLLHYCDLLINLPPIRFFLGLAVFSAIEGTVGDNLIV